jgi:pyruvate/2-oxoglutarate dehydrogenase complex dihydrolipoamide acyltransferase (E2) component
MQLDVRMPQFGESAAEATVVAWLVQPGATVSAEQELVEVQTEKSLLTVAAPASGTLAIQRVAAGEKVAVGDVLAVLDVAAGTPGAVASTAAPSAASQVASAQHRDNAPVERRRPARGDATLRASFGDAAFISPAVRARLLEAGLTISDLATIPGTGAGGRVTVEDLEAYLVQGEAMSPVRQAVAGAMSRSWQRPLATVAKPARMDPLLAHRRTIEGRPSATVYALRALALALVAQPTLACRLYGNRLLKAQSIDLAVAVEFDDGVLTPVIRGVEKLGLSALTLAVDQVIDRARAGRVSDAGSAVATISNYGTFGLTWATPIPLPGQASILGLGSVENVPDWDPATKSWARVRQAELTLTFDHRIADGGAAGRLLQLVGELIEHPERM